MEVKIDKGNKLYSGKVKSLFETNDSGKLVMHFSDIATAFNAEKEQELDYKGVVNNYFNAYFMELLQQHGIDNHFEKIVDNNNSLVTKLNMLPLECVVRNIAAGSICKRLGLTNGEELTQPIFEFFYKDDVLGDPLINESHILTFNWATAEQISKMRELTLKVNKVLQAEFIKGDLILVDFKIEFGLNAKTNQLMLGDEITPDGCRIWDKTTKKSLDKDRFRHGLGGVVDSYIEIANRLNIKLPETASLV